MKTKRISMLVTKDGSPDGIQVRTFEKGKTYDVPETLADIFLRERWAREVKDCPGPQNTKEKDDAKASHTTTDRASDTE